MIVKLLNRKEDFPETIILERIYIKEEKKKLSYILVLFSQGNKLLCTILEKVENLKG